MGAGGDHPPVQDDVDDAAAFIHEHCGQDWGDAVEEDPSFALALYKDAAKRLHPDVGGDVALFKKLQQARDVLVRAYEGASA